MQRGRHLEKDKQAVRSFWEQATCGEALYLSRTNRAAYEQQARTRYELEPFIRDFARFSDYQRKEVLEIGIGLGADHQQFAEAGAVLTGLDITVRAVKHTHNRFNTFGLRSGLLVGDAEKLPFPDRAFDLVYSWGVLHHSPHTDRAVMEVLRVLKPGGEAKIMIYHKYSMVGFMLWIRYALLRLNPFLSLDVVYHRYLESPGTKAYTVNDARKLFGSFSACRINTVLTHGDLLTSAAGQRHQGWLLAAARMLWPRRIIEAFFSKNGLFMLITAIK
jgi:SAM-dependent methyltransferase